MSYLNVKGMIICKNCGEDMTGKGLIYVMKHLDTHMPAYEYKVPTDNEAREMFLAMGMPLSVFRAFGYAEPTPMERIIFKED